MTGLDLSQVKFDSTSNVIDLGIALFNPKSSIIKTRRGGDKLIGTDSVNGDFGMGVLVGAAAQNAQNINSVIASAEFSGNNVAANGIKNKGILKTGRGRDLVEGTATANISAVAQTVSQAIAIADTADTGVITNAFASIKVRSTADGIDNSGGEINNGQGQDGIYGDTEGSVAAVATATADASAIVEAVAKAPVSDGLTAFAGAFAQSLAKATIIARGINNKNGKITTVKGRDTIHATATSSAEGLSQSAALALLSGTPGNQALAQSVADAFAKVKDKAIAIDNTNGEIRTGAGKDILTGEASGSDSYGIFGGDIYMGDGADTVEASSFGGGVNIRMGNGKDFVEGFGDAKINGGDGDDIFSLGSYNIEEFDNISFGANNNKVMFERDGITMTTTNFEEFIFGNENNLLTYDELYELMVAV
ncbi:hypothetical protein ACP6PL_25170 [Dapis sp. BLCC M126]|uniref:hypothetical protein n=1 Tax=Dapis sp. BLCC M126 TaxID=3400189 RepID=UPI003CF5745B